MSYGRRPRVDRWWCWWLFTRRARYGQVPLPAILDVEPCGAADAMYVGAPSAAAPLAGDSPSSGGTGGGSSTGGAGGGVLGQVAFLSHEAHVSGGPGYKLAG